MQPLYELCEHRSYSFSKEVTLVAAGQLTIRTMSNGWGVAFTSYMVIYGIQTQGAGDKEEWVTSFYLSYRTQYGSFYEFIRTNDGGIRVSL